MTQSSKHGAVCQSTNNINRPRERERDFEADCRRVKSNTIEARIAVVDVVAMTTRKLFAALKELKG